jgi:hypothetical protein
MFHLLLILALLFGGLYYAETHGLVNPGGIIPDLTRLHLPQVKLPHLGDNPRDFE